MSEKEESSQGSEGKTKPPVPETDSDIYIIEKGEKGESSLGIVKKDG